MVTLSAEKSRISTIFTAAEPVGSELPLLRAALVNGGRLQGLEAAREVVSSGFTAVDALLPTGGLRRGSLVEWLATTTDAAAGPSPHAQALGDLESGAGAATLAFAVACRLAGVGTGPTMTGPRMIVVVDRTEWFHPPAVLPWLTAGQQLVVTRPGRDDDEIWAIDQALRCSGVAAVVAWPRPQGQARQRNHWSTALRRWQLAARGSGAVGLLVRPQAAARDPSWAEARIAVAPMPGGTLSERRLQLTRVGGSWIGTDRSQSTETVLELVRGTETMLTGKTARRLQPSRQGISQPGGATCRAS
jgi:protein ImuA